MGTHRLATPPAETSGTGRRRFLGYPLATPTRDVGARPAREALGAGPEAWAEAVPSGPQPPEFYDLLDALGDDARPTASLVTSTQMITAEEMDLQVDGAQMTLPDARAVDPGPPERSTITSRPGTPHDSAATRRRGAASGDEPGPPVRTRRGRRRGHQPTATRKDLMAADTGRSRPAGAGNPGVDLPRLADSPERSPPPRNPTRPSQTTKTPAERGSDALHEPRSCRVFEVVSPRLQPGWCLNRPDFLGSCAGGAAEEQGQNAEIVRRHDLDDLVIVSLPDSF